MPILQLNTAIDETPQRAGLERWITGVTAGGACSRSSWHCSVSGSRSMARAPRRPIIPRSAHRGGGNDSMNAASEAPPPPARGMTLIEIMVVIASSASSPPPWCRRVPAAPEGASVDRTTSTSGTSMGAQAYNTRKGKYPDTATGLKALVDMRSSTRCRRTPGATTTSTRWRTAGRSSSPTARTVSPGGDGNADISATRPQDRCEAADAPELMSASAPPEASR